jgi:hypothetical protein
MMMRIRVFGTAVLVAAIAACAPKLQAPRESVRVTGTLEDVDAPAPAPTATPERSAEATPGPGSAPAGRAKSTPVRVFPVLRQMPLGVAVYEACSPQLYIFKKCPGTFLGEAKLVKAGPFVVEVDTKSTEVVVFGFRGFLGPEQEQEACAEAKVAVQDLKSPITLKLQPGACSIKLERRYG